ncbi:MAG: hydrogenase maturation protease, partial [candidate division WOR-3 bacterium]
MPQKTLIIGIGNPFLTDDGIGPFLVDYLKLRLPASYLFKKEIDLDFADLEDMRGFDTVIIIDAFMQNKSLGTISVIKVPALE